MSKKRNKKYQPKGVNTGKFMTAFLCEHDSFIMIDNVMNTIKTKGKLTYKQGIGFVYMSELGEEKALVSEIENWIKEWREVTSSLSADYDDTALVKLKNKLNLGIALDDAEIAAAESLIDLQRKMYRSLAVKEPLKDIVRQAVQSVKVTNEIKQLVRGFA